MLVRNLGWEFLEWLVRWLVFFFFFGWVWIERRANTWVRPYRSFVEAGGVWGGSVLGGLFKGMVSTVLFFS